MTDEEAMQTILDAELKRLSIKDGLLALHRRQNNNYDGFDNFNDYAKYGDMFVKVEVPQEEE